MNQKYKKVKKSYRQKRRVRVRRTAIIAMLLIVVGLASTLCWFVARNIVKAAATGEEPVSAQSASATAPAATTATLPTIAVNASITTPHIVLYDVTHSAMLYSSRANEKCYPASLTKLLTATLATEYCGPDEVFTVGSEIFLVNSQSSKAGLVKGYKLNREMILKALLLPSGNDAAYVIAAHVGRKVSGNSSLSDIEAIRTFIDLMNKEAQKLGTTGSHFSDPDGFYDANHYTTAADMLLIAKNALRFSNIQEIVSKPSDSITLLSGQKFTWKNSNVLLNPNSGYYFSGANGMKTGYTNEAGYCVIASAKRNGVELLAVIMGGTSDDSRWRDAVSILKEGFQAESSSETSAPTTAAAQ